MKGGCEESAEPVPGPYTLRAWVILNGRQKKDHFPLLYDEIRILDADF